MTLRRAPEVFQRRTCSIVGGHGARDKLGCSRRPSQKRINVWMLVSRTFNFWFDNMFMLDNVGV